jgi:curved DNA-binding protein CbpA
MRPLVAANSSSRSCTARQGGGRGQRRLGIGRVVACYLILVVTLLLVHYHGGSVVAASSSSSKDNNNNNNNTSYEWEDLNYYQILGLGENNSQSSSPDGDASGTSSITSKDIRKAYRRQAQQWHPDKLVHKQGQGKDQNITVEESNARFAKIAEAYSVLNNDDKRNDYNRYLRQQQREQWQEQEHREQQQQQRDKQDKSRQQQQPPQQAETASSWTTWTWNDFSMQDPLRMFEEFFYGTAEDDDDDDDWTHHYQAHGDPYSEYPRGSTFFGGSSGGGTGSSSSYARGSPYQSKSNSNPHPIRTYQEEQVWMDPASGREILRILQTDEYQGQQQGQVYYTVVAQDFVEEWDRYQRAFVFYPLQREPFVVDEGYRDRPETTRTASSSRRRGEESNNYKQQQQQRGTLVSTLLPESVLVSDNDRPLLQNGRFTAVISSRCELWIADSVWDTIVWTSETDLLLGYHLYQQQSIQCQLALRGPHLVLATVGYPEQLLWYSDADNVDDDYYYNDATASDDSYFARLDSDGSLAVYQRRTVDSPRWLLRILSSSLSSRDNEKPITGAGTWAAAPRRIGKTLLRLVFDRVPSLSLEEPVLTRRSSSTSSSSSSSLPTLQRLVCVSATGPVGCLSVLRPVVKWLRDAVHAVQWAVSKLDHFLETV